MFKATLCPLSVLLLVRDPEREDENHDLPQIVRHCLLLHSGLHGLSTGCRGSEWNEMTKIQLNEPIEIPGMVSPAGAYWFVLLDSQSEQQTDRSKIYATALTVATQRTQPTNWTEIKLAERLHSQPEAVLDWYYPGLLIGHELLYPTNEEKELMGDAKEDVVALPMNGNSNSATRGE